MKHSARLYCLIAWVLATIVEIVFISSLPSKIIISGIDLSEASTSVTAHQVLLILLGLLIAVFAYVWKKRSSFFVIISSALYLLHWFPYGSIQKYGLVVTFNTMWSIGSNPGLRLTAITRDV